MAFYEDRVSIARINDEEIYIFKNKRSEISMDYYNLNEGHTGKTICKDAHGEFDILIDGGKINIIYQNIKNELKLITIDKVSIKEESLGIENLPKIYEIKMTLNNGIKSIIYLSPKFSQKGVFEIYHHILKDDIWEEFKVDETRVSKFLNPIKIVNDKSSLSLFYYYGDQICMKEFNFTLLEWKESIVLTDNTDKLYIDVLKDKDYVHLVYSQYIDQNLSIKYKKYGYKEDSLYEKVDRTISNLGNTTHPTLVLTGDRLWVVWKDSFGLKSSFSDDRGENFSEIYLWKKTKTYKYVRYDYKDKGDNKDLKLNHSFGTIYPDINFLGFGELIDVEEIKRKGRD